MSEYKDVEKPCINIAVSAGWLHRKLDSGPGGKGWPDGLFMGKNNEHFFVEFKDFDTPVSPKQQRKIESLRELGHAVYIIDNEADFSVALTFHDMRANMNGRKFKNPQCPL